MYSSTILSLDLGRLHSVWVKDLFQHDPDAIVCLQLLSVHVFSFSCLSLLPLTPCGVSGLHTFQHGQHTGETLPCYLSQPASSHFVIFLFLHGKGGFSRYIGRFVAHVAVENFVQPFLCSSTAFLLVPPDMQWEGSCWQLSQVCTVLIPA